MGHIKSLGKQQTLEVRRACAPWFHVW